MGEQSSDWLDLGYLCQELVLTCPLDTQSSVPRFPVQGAFFRSTALLRGRFHDRGDLKPK